ncbi:DUF397 domain-containing protein [Streptomyces sp. AJS327]|nr:DUF397 domain-containing protein [Streptomyces sp. AJS327]
MAIHELPPEGAWFKSSYSDGTGNNCIEVAGRSSRIYVRDSKQRKKGTSALVFSPSTFSAFTEGLRAGGIGLGCP